jgi:hypothetical protein
MSEELIVGLLTLAIPLLGAGYLMLHRNAGIFRMFVALLVIGLGYLGFTGSLADIGRTVLGKAGMETMSSPEPAESTPPAAEPPPAPAADSTTPPAAETPSSEAPATEAPTTETAPAETPPAAEPPAADQPSSDSAPATP